MKTIILLFCLLAIAFSQTVVYIGSNGTNSNQDYNSMVYRVGVLAELTGSAFQWDTTYIKRIMEFVPSLQGKIALYPVWALNFTSDVVLSALNCYYDAVIAETGITTQNLGYGSVFTDPVEYTNGQAYYSWFINLPKGQADNRSCKSICIKSGVCGVLSLQDIANYATNANVPVNVRYDEGTYRDQAANDIKNALASFGFSGQVNIIPYAFNANPLDYVLNANPNNSIEIAYTSQADRFCPYLGSLNGSASVFTTLSNIPPIAFPVCPKNLELRDLLNYGIYRYRNTDQFCVDQILYNDYCITNPPLFPNDPTNDRCFNYPFNPICGI